LDEPTNHLDLQATVWLEKFLAGCEGAVVLISHDRYLLDKIAQKIIEVDSATARVWSGNYSNFIETKKTVELHQRRQYEQRVEFVERTKDFIARNKDQEGMRGTAKGRKTRLKRLLKEQPDFLERPVERKTVHFGFEKAGSRSELILRCEGLSKSFDKVRLFEDLTFDIAGGERFAITGPNGSGKSTFLKMALGQIEPTQGIIRLGQNLKTGYLDQHARILDLEKTALEEAAIANQQLTPEQLRSRLGAFLFSGDEVHKKCGQLSGGQQSRLMICKLVLSCPDVLVLDEPTNHLDIDSREMLEQALESYEGTIIVVSHDRFFIDRIADRLLIMGVDQYGRRSPGKSEFVAIKPVYSYYASKLAERQQQLTQDRPVKLTKRRPQPSRIRQIRKTPDELKRFNKYPVEQIEQMIMELEGKISQTKERFGEQEIYKKPALLMQLKKEYEAMNDELALLYRAYEWRAS
jgi:ATP-binding cassette subfamily F protein 3